VVVPEAVQVNSSIDLQEEVLKQKKKYTLKEIPVELWPELAGTFGNNYIKNVPQVDAILGIKNMSNTLDCLFINR
jgi:hypothetical protein